MENNSQDVKTNKERKGITGFLVFIIVVLLLVIGIGSGWYFGKNGEMFNSNKEQGTNNTAKVETSENATKAEKNEPAKENNAKTEIVEKTREMTTDEIYSIYSKNMQNKIKSLGKDLPKELEGNSWINIKDIQGTEDFPVGCAYVNEKLEACIALKETGDKIKILDNAINCGICFSGNGGTLYVIWAVDVNGDLYTKTYDTQDTANRMNFNLVKEQKVKNIVEVIQCSGPSARYPLVIDISGNAYNL